MLTAWDYQQLNQQGSSLPLLPHCLSAVSTALHITLPRARTTVLIHSPGDLLAHSSLSSVASSDVAASSSSHGLVANSSVAAILCSLYNLTSVNQPWLNAAGWCDYGVSVCSWSGVGCDGPAARAQATEPETERRW